MPKHGTRKKSPGSHFSEQFDQTVISVQGRPSSFRIFLYVMNIEYAFVRVVYMDYLSGGGHGGYGVLAGLLAGVGRMLATEFNGERSGTCNVALLVCDL